MKLISCNSCGLVYDQDMIQFPPMYETRDGYVDEELIDGNSMWNGNGFSRCFICVNEHCKNSIVEED